MPVNARPKRDVTAPARVLTGIHTSCYQTGWRIPAWRSRCTVRGRVRQWRPWQSGAQKRCAGDSRSDALCVACVAKSLRAPKGAARRSWHNPWRLRNFGRYAATVLEGAKGAAQHLKAANNTRKFVARNVAYVARIMPGVSGPPSPPRPSAESRGPGSGRSASGDRGRTGGGWLRAGR
jgi:hypothetical protein